VVETVPNPTSAVGDPEQPLIGQSRVTDELIEGPVYEGVIQPDYNETRVRYVREAEDLVMLQVAELLFHVYVLNPATNALIEHKRKRIAALPDEIHQLGSE
jgi:hypothetical protein